MVICKYKGDKLLSSIKRLLLFCLCRWYRNGNRIIVHKKDGKVVECFNYFGLSVRFKGKNSIIEIYEPIKFQRRLLVNRSHIKVEGDNNYICIFSSCRSIHNIQAKAFGSNNKLIIGKNWYQNGFCFFDFGLLDNSNIVIGDNCMFGQDTKFMLGDYHSVLDVKTNKCLNIPRKGINIGNHVWIARDVRIMKNVTIPDDCIVGAGSNVTKEFSETNCIIAGNPARIVKNNITWDYKNTK